MRISARLDDALADKVKHLMRVRKKKISDIVKDSIEQYYENCMKLENSIIADKGFGPALANRKDRSRSHARRALEEPQPALIVTWSVMTETCRLLSTLMKQYAAWPMVMPDGRCIE